MPKKQGNLFHQHLQRTVGLSILPLTFSTLMSASPTVLADTTSPDRNDRVESSTDAPSGESRSDIHQSSSNQTSSSDTAASAASAAPAAASSQAPADSEVAQLDTMVVTASGFGQQIEDAPASISVVKRQQIEDKAYTDVTDALQDMPGVVVSNGGSQKDITIRGMESKYTLILVDGKRMGAREGLPNGNSSGIEQKWLPPLAAIERIEVVRGPMSSLYGSDAMGGVINIITRKGTDHWYGSLGAESTLQQHSKSGNGQQADAFISGPLIEGLMGIQLRGLSDYRHEDKYVNGFRQQKDSQGDAKLTLTPNKYNDLYVEYGRTIAHRDRHAGKSVAATGADQYSTYTQNNASLGHTVRWGSLGQTDSYIQRVKTDNVQYDIGYRETTAETKTTFNLPRNYLTVGAQYDDQKLTDGSNQSNPDMDTLKRWNYSLFAENEWAVTDNFSLTAGARFNKDENYGSHWSPRLYGVWHITDAVAVKGGVSTGYKTPDLRNAVADWGTATGHGSGVIRGNPDLQPEKSTTEELGFVWDASSNLQLGATVYNTDFKDKITEVRSCSDPDGNYTCDYRGDKYTFVSDLYNVDKARMQGVELTGDWRINAAWTLNANYTYTKTEQRTGEFKGQSLNEMPRNMINTVLNWKANNQWSSWARVNWRDKETSYIARGRSAEGVASYTMVDLGAVYKATPQLKLTAGIYNLLDKRIDYDDYGKTLDGRRLTVGMNFDF